MWLLDLTKDSNDPQIIIGKVIYRKTLQEKLQKLQNRTTDNYEIRFDMKCLNLETTCLYRLILPPNNSQRFKRFISIYGQPKYLVMDELKGKGVRRIFSKIEKTQLPFPFNYIDGLMKLSNSGYSVG